MGTVWDVSHTQDYNSLYRQISQRQRHYCILRIVSNRSLEMPFEMSHIMFY